MTADAVAAVKEAAVALDFSLPGCVAAHARACVQAGVPLLVDLQPAGRHLMEDFHRAGGC